MRILAILAFLFAAATPLAAQPAESSVVVEARAFMASYAVAMMHSDRAQIATRYDRNGAYILGHGSKRFETYAQIQARYANATWPPAYRFEWQDLTYEPLGPSTVMVLGLYVWIAEPGAPPITFSYTALLHRQDGVLRIRMEHESTDTPREPTAD